MDIFRKIPYDVQRNICTFLCKFYILDGILCSRRRIYYADPRYAMLKRVFQWRFDQNEYNNKIDSRFSLRNIMNTLHAEGTTFHYFAQIIKPNTPSITTCILVIYFIYDGNDGTLIGMRYTFTFYKNCIDKFETYFKQPMRLFALNVVVSDLVIVLVCTHMPLVPFITSLAITATSGSVVIYADIANILTFVGYHPILTMYYLNQNYEKNTDSYFVLV